MEKHGLKKPRPSMSLPQYLIEHKEGLGGFIKPDEGKEILLQYNTVVTGLKKNGEILTEEETEAIWWCVNTDTVSPALVKRLLREHGGEASITKAFLLEKCDQESLAFPLEQAAKLLSVSDRHLRDFVNSGELKSFRLGRTLRISKRALWQFIAKKEMEGGICSS